MVTNAPSRAHFVEVGVWKGRSAAYMVERILESKKSIRFDCVDTWAGSPTEEIHQHDPDVLEGRLYERFLENMAPFDGHFNAVCKPSTEAAAGYADGSLDFVFIDAAHDYSNVRADIAAWLPKIKREGTLAGHDYTHPPVRRAVSEILPRSRLTREGMSWIYRSP
jgi:hypothetical protein